MTQPSAPPKFEMPRIEALVKRVALYCRVSTKEQAHGYSMGGQEQDGLAHIEANPYLHLFKVYRDPGVSGAKFSRPDLDKLREDIRNRFVDVVIVKAIDRIGRSERVLMPWFWMLEEAGVDTISLTQNIDTTTSNGQFALRVFIAQAQAEWKAIRERTVGGLNAKAKQGGWVCGTPPYGYALEGRGSHGGSRVVSHPEELQVIKKAADYILKKGYSSERAATALNADGHLTRSGVPWTAANLKLRMSGPVFDGFTLYRGLVNKGTKTIVGPDGKPEHGPTQKIPLPQVLDNDTVQGLRAYFASRSTPRGNREHLYYLSGRVTGTCGGYFVGRRVTQTETHMYFCFEHSGNATGKGCKYYRAELIENAVWQGIVGIFGERDLLERAADDWIGALPANEDDCKIHIAELDARLSENKRIRTTQLMQYATMGVAPVVVKAAQDRLEAEAKEFQAQRAVARTLLSELETAMDRREQLVSLAGASSERLLSLAPHIRAQIIEMLDLKVEFVRDPKNTRLAHPCKIEAYFRETKKPVPDTLTDEQWEVLVPKVPALSLRNRKISLRTVLEAGFYKVRNDVRWKELPIHFGKEASLRAVWLKWVKDGVLADVAEAMGDYGGTMVDESRELPEMRVYGVLEGQIASLMG